jgi:hypothetical protein
MGGTEGAVNGMRSRLRSWWLAMTGQTKPATAISLTKAIELFGADLVAAHRLIAGLKALEFRRSLTAADVAEMNRPGFAGGCLV